MSQGDGAAEARTAKSGTVSPAGWRMLILVSSVQLLSLMDRNILAILNPKIKADLNIGDAEIGLLYGTVFALFYALFSLPIGRLADGWVRTRLLAISISVWSLATGLAAMANGFTLLAVSRLGVGIGEASAQPAGTSLIYDHFPKARRGLAMAVFASAVATGLGLSLALGGLAADWWDAQFPAGTAPLGLADWQFAFLLAALPGFPLAYLMWRAREPVRGAIDGIATPPHPAPFRASGHILGSMLPVTNWVLFWHSKARTRHWLFNCAAIAVIVVSMMAIARWCMAFSPRPPLMFGSLSVNPHVLQWSVVGFGLIVLLNLAQSLRLNDRPAFAIIFGSPSVLLCLGAGGLQMIIIYGIMGFTPQFIMHNYGLSPTETGLQFGVFTAFIGIVGPLLSGPFSDLANRWWPGGGRVLIVLLALGISPLLLPWLYSAGDPATFYWRFLVHSTLLAMWLPPFYAVLYDQVLPRVRGITSSIYLFVTTIMGLGMGPYLVGMIADAHDGDIAQALETVNWVAPAIVVMLVVLVFRAGRDESRLLDRARAAGEQV